MSKTTQDRELHRLRREQINSASDHIAPLLDAWDHLSDDQKQTIKADAPAFTECLNALEDAWMS